MLRMRKISPSGRDDREALNRKSLGSSYAGLVRHLENLRQNDQEISRKYLSLDSRFRGNDGRVVDENLWFQLCRVREINPSPDRAHFPIRHWLPSPHYDSIRIQQIIFYFPLSFTNAFQRFLAGAGLWFIGLKRSLARLIWKESPSRSRTESDFIQHHRNPAKLRLEPTKYDLTIGKVKFDPFSEAEREINKSVPHPNRDIHTVELPCPFRYANRSNKKVSVKLS
uniref:Uncharacterized protein n=1 Tax=Candidatus Kentrum sp. LPFa TaxID=2126335 RepID=A0A450W4A7_9GAMM|nr:MAG: hypothetical protein BECKLPF1236B_GA0070989_102617 [Candidatus Kentron sp. LPFa]